MTSPNETFASGIVPPPAAAEGRYVPYAATRELLRVHVARLEGGPLAVLRAIGWRGTDSHEVVRRWQDLRGGRVPAAFVRTIGITEPDLRAALEADVARWEEASLRQPVRVSGFIVRVLPAVYQHSTLPREMTLAAAIEHVALVARQHHQACVIPVGGIKTVGVEPDGRVWVSDHRPEIRVVGRWLVFEAAGPALGCTTLG